LKRNDIDMVVLSKETNLILLDQIIRRGILFEGDKERREEFEQKILHLAIDFKTQRLANMGNMMERILGSFVRGSVR